MNRCETSAYGLSFNILLKKPRVHEYTISTMRSGRSGGRGGRGTAGRGGRGRGRGSSYSVQSGNAKKGLCVTLGTNVFDYGTKGAADQMRTSWEKLVQYVGTNYGQDISNELQKIPQRW